MNTQEACWEEAISLNPMDVPAFSVLESAAHHKAAEEQDHRWEKCGFTMDTEQALAADSYPLPVTADREGYHGDRHYSYWMSGLLDFDLLKQCCERLDVKMGCYLDLGCASGRVIRHPAIQCPDMQVLGCDINRRHVEWVARYMPENIRVFQNTSVPHLPLEDNSVDVITAYSVFTHIEAFETAWLMELRRILKPGGTIWATVHTENTWRKMKAGWPLYDALLNHPGFQSSYVPGQDFEGDKAIFRWRADMSYSSNIFYTTDYLKRSWGRIFDVAEVHRQLPSFQDVVVLRK